MPRLVPYLMRSSKKSASEVLPTYSSSDRVPKACCGA
jgi:hypothetical protein